MTDAYDQPAPQDSYAAWWAQTHQAQEPEVQQLQEQLNQQYQQLQETLENL